MVCNTPSPLDEQQIQFAIISFSIYTCRVYDHDDKYVYSFFAQKGRKYILNEKKKNLNYHKGKPCQPLESHKAFLTLYMYYAYYERG